MNVFHSNSMESISAEALEPFELNLTWKGLSFVNWDCGEDDFKFAFGDNQDCRVHSVLAEFISPKIAKIRKCDPLWNVYTFDNDSCELFDVLDYLFSNLRSGHPLHVDNSNFIDLLRLSRELENSELFSSLAAMVKIESLTVEDLILLLQNGIELGTAFSERFGNLRDFVASHFYEIKSDALESLDLETARLLLSSPSLKIKDEDSLYDFIQSRSEKDPSFANLFEFVYFEYLSVDHIKMFATFARENLLENINAGIWTRICGRLLLETKRERKKNSRAVSPPDIEFDYNGSKPLKGIIAHLTHECGGNIHDNGVVNVTASSFNDASYHPKNVVDLRKDSYYYSKYEQDTWICLDFKDKSVIPKSYSLRTCNNGPGGCHLKSWVFEASNDGKTWTTVDRRDNNYDLNDRHVTRNFGVSHGTSERFRFIRLRQTGQNHRGDFCVILTALEVFGVLCE